MGRIKTKTLHCWLNYTRAQYAISRDMLAAANRAKAPRGEIMRRLNHWRCQCLNTAIELRTRLPARKVPA